MFRIVYEKLKKVYWFRDLIYHYLQTPIINKPKLMESLLEQQSSISTLLGRLQKELDSYDNKEPSQKDKAIVKIQKMLEELKSQIEAFEYDRIELAASSDLSNSGIFENNLKDYEEQYDKLEKLFFIKKDPSYAEKLAIMQNQSKYEYGDSKFQAYRFITHQIRFKTSDAW